MIETKEEYLCKLNSLEKLLEKSNKSPLGKMINLLENELVEYESIKYPATNVHIRDRIEYLLDQSNVWNTL
jgi:hypothetical protein